MSPEETAKQVRAFISIGEDWKDTSFYEAGRMNTIPQDADQVPYEYQSYFDFRYSQGPRGAGGPSPNSGEAEWTRNKIIELLDEYECESVAEIGCGAMVRWDELPREHYVGIDVSPVAISHAKQKFPEASFVVEDSTQITPPAADAVICIDVLQHIKPEDVEKLVSSIVKQARKLAIIKTSVNIPNLYYQFNHDWNALGGEAAYELTVPGVPVSRVFVFAASGGRGGICQAAVASPAPPSFSEACCDSDSRVSAR